MDYVNGKSLKLIAASLGRFADSRATAKEPRDRLVVQADGQEIKVIAGASWGTLIARVHATTQTFRAIVSAREFLTLAKSASARNSYRIVDLNLGWEVGCSLQEVDSGEATNFLRLTKTLPKIILPPVGNSQGSVSIPGEGMKDLGAVADAISDDINPWVSVGGWMATNKHKTIRFAMADHNRTMWAARDFSGTYELFGRISVDFLNASRDITDAIIMLYDDEHVTIENETYKAIGMYNMFSHEVPFVIKDIETQDRAVIDRTRVKKLLQDTGKFDNAGRVVIQCRTGELNVHPLKVDSPKGVIVDSRRLARILGAITEKQVGIGLRPTGQPVNIRIPEWSIELAPIVL